MARVSCKIQKIFDHYVEQNPYFGKTCIAEVAGAASPKLSKKNTSFLVASPVEAKHQNKALPLMFRALLQLTDVIVTRALALPSEAPPTERSQMSG